MWKLFGTFVIRNRFWMLLGLGLFTLAMTYFATQVKMTYDFAKVVPKDDPDFVEYIKFKETFGEDGNIMVIGIQQENLFDSAVFNDWTQLSLAIEKVDGVEKVLSVSKLYKLTLNDSSNRLAFTPLYKSGILSQVQVDSIKQEIAKLKFYEGLLYNPQNHVTLMAVSLKKDKLDSKARIPLVNSIEELSNKFGQKYHTEIHYSGLPYVRTIFSSKVSEEIKLFTYLSVAITAIFIFIFFRFISAVVFSLIVVIIGVIFTLGTLALFGYKITLLTGVLPPLMVIIGVQNCIYLLNVYHQEFARHGNKMFALIRLISKNGLALFLTNVTTAVGFMVFSFSGSSVLDQFSVVSGIVIMVIYLISLIFIPVVYSYLPPPQSHHIKHLEGVRLNKVLDYCNYLVYHQRKLIYGTTLVLMALSVYGAFHVKNLGYVVDDLPPQDKVFLDLKFFEKHLKGTLPFEISIDTKKVDGLKDYATLQKINRLEKELAQYKEFSKPVSVVDFVKFANQGMHNGDARFYVVPGVVEIGEMMSHLPNNNPAGRGLLKSMVDSNFQVARVSIQMADIGSQEMKVLSNKVQQKVDSIFDPTQYKVKLTGTSAIFLKGNDYLIDNLIQSMIAALVIISVMMAFLFFSWKMVLISLIPNLIPLMLTYGVMGFFDIRLKPSTIIIFSIAYGIVVDFTIHYLAKYRNSLKKHNWEMDLAIPESLREAGPSIIYTAVALFAGFIIFAASNFQGTVALGVLTSLALFLGMLMNLLLLPSMLLSLAKRINSKKEFETTLIDVETED